MQNQSSLSAGLRLFPLIPGNQPKKLYILCALLTWPQHLCCRKHPKY